MNDETEKTPVAHARRCPAARQARFGKCERIGCGHVAGANVRVCNCCSVQLGITARDRLTLLRITSSAEEIIKVEDEYLEKLNAMPARVPVRRSYR